jgi:hypothetical protein
LPFDIGCADTAKVRIAGDFAFLDADAFRRRITLLAFDPRRNFCMVNPPSFDYTAEVGEWL